MKNENISYQLITNAGNSKSFSMLAIEAARENNFKKAKDLLLKAKKELKKAHQIQFQLIQNEAQGNHLNMDVILVHAQDHLSMALMMKEQAAEFVNIYEEIDKLKKGGE